MQYHTKTENRLLLHILLNHQINSDHTPHTSLDSISGLCKWHWSSWWLALEMVPKLCRVL